MAKLVSQQLAQLVGKAESYIKHSRHFIGLINHINLSEEDMLMSFDDESLISKVSITETVNIIEEKLSPEVAEMVL